MNNNLLERSNVARKFPNKGWLFDQSWRKRVNVFEYISKKFGVFYKTVYWWFVSKDIFIFLDKKSLPKEVWQLIAQKNYWLKSYSLYDFIFLLYLITKTWHFIKKHVHNSGKPRGYPRLHISLCLFSFPNHQITEFEEDDYIIATSTHNCKKGILSFPNFLL